MSLTKTSRIHARRPTGCIYPACRCGMGTPKQNSKSQATAKLSNGREQLVTAKGQRQRRGKGHGHLQDRGGRTAYHRPTERAQAQQRVWLPQRQRQIRRIAARCATAISPNRALRHRDQNDPHSRVDRLNNPCSVHHRNACPHRALQPPASNQSPIPPPQSPPLAPHLHQHSHEP